MKMQFRSVDVDCVSPRCRIKSNILMTDQSVTPATGTSFALGTAFMSHHDGTFEVGRSFTSNHHLSIDLTF